MFVVCMYCTVHVVVGFLCVVTLIWTVHAFTVYAQYHEKLNLLNCFHSHVHTCVCTMYMYFCIIIFL